MTANGRNCELADFKKLISLADIKNFDGFEKN
jgi:hypothetical protein